MIKSRFTLKQLEALVYVNDTGTFRKAAVALGTTQPNISARISGLEDTLGDVLLHRDAGSIRLTTKGQNVLAQARRVLRDCEELLEIAERRDLIEERLRLGVTELVACRWLQHLMRLIKHEYPNLRIQIEVNLAVELERMLRADEVDLAIISGPLRHSNMDVELVARSPYVWVANTEMFEKLGANPALKRVLEAPAITHARKTQAVTALDAECEKLNFPKDLIVHSSSLSTCVPMAVDGMGVALLPVELVKKEIETKQLHIVDCGWVPPPLEFFACLNGSRATNFVLRSKTLAFEALAARR